MTSVSYSVPAMYADHHILRVREALTDLDGVVNVMASAAGKRVTVEYTDSISPGDIEQALIEAGYSPNQDPPMLELPKSTDDGSSWYALIQRVTRTEMKDLEMSGDFRRY